MPILTYTELNSICIQATTPRAYYPPVYNSFLVDLYKTGCRPNEITNKARWTALSPTTFQLQPLKGNGLRYLNSTDLTPNFIDWITGASQNYQYCTYTKMKGIWSNNQTVPQIYKDSKPMDLYCFRYRYVKFLHRSGFSDLDIQSIMGWTELAMVDSYVNAILYTL